MEKPSQHASACTNILHACTARKVVIRYTPARKKHCTSITPPLQSNMPSRFWAARKYASPWRNSLDWRNTIESTPCPFLIKDVAIEPLAYIRSWYYISLEDEKRLRSLTNKQDIASHPIPFNRTDLTYSLMSSSFSVGLKI